MTRVLVIDDNKDLRELIGITLEANGYAVDLACDGQEGLQAQRARPADVVITDIFMPNQDGIETIAQFRKEYPGLKLIAMSGDAKLVKHSAHLLAVSEMGTHGVLPKPFDEEDLLRAIREALG
jgi:CheY-like chemotaxis protein